jgi:hypothetical protein
MIDLVASEATVLIVFGAISGLALLLTTVAVVWVFYTAFDDYEGSVRDVQRFIKLTDEARSLVPNGLPLFDQERAAATTTAIGRFSARKDEARRALWQPRAKREEATISATPARAQPSREPSLVGPVPEQAR